MKRFAFILLLLLGCFSAMAEVIPSAPKLYFNDYANVTSGDTASRLNKTLEDFERATSSQILVAVYPKMDSDSSIEDYTVRVAQSWKVGQKGKDNGAVLFVFIQNRTMFLQVGYGLEGVLPDALCKRIIENEIKPHFKAGDFNSGLSAGVTAILAATKGEYKGSGRTVYESHYRIPKPVNEGFIWMIVSLGLLLLIFISAINAMRPTTYSRCGHRSRVIWFGLGGGSNSSGGGGFSSGGGGGGFSGGGGSFGGGGAGGSW